MALGSEWRDRLNVWIERLKEMRVRRLADVDFEFATTFEMLTPSQAGELDFQPVRPGETWGEPWQYGWFRATLEVSKAADGRTLVLEPPTAAESLVYVNGQVCCGSSWARHPVIIAPQAQAGETLEIMIEAYASHEWGAHGGPVPPGKKVTDWKDFRKPSLQQGGCGVMAEDVLGLYYDVVTLYELRNELEETSLRRANIDAALKAFTNLCDPELPYEEFIGSCRAARERLAPELAKTNGPTAPKMYAFGHGHLDIMWLWPYAETRRKMARTVSNQLLLAQRYPQHKFLQPQCHLLWMLQEDYPDLYGRLKRAVAEGTVIVDGATWVEMDTNISGGEAIIRQFLHGKAFYRDEFGVESEMLWIPDVFGYSAQMPQIMAGCGVKYFTTQKIFWAYHGGQAFPYNTFWWEGIDGSDVLVHLHNDYNARTTPEHVCRRWKERVQKDDIDSRLMPFGWGDGGGGPALEHLEFIRRIEDLEGCPRVQMAEPMEYFRDLEKGPEITHRYVGELYFQAHRGVLTTQAKTKQGNRRCELALREAEMWAVAAIATGKDSEADAAKRLWPAWRTVLLNQFHDILPGSSIARVYEEVEASYVEALEQAMEVKESAVAALTDGEAGLTVFNSLSWDRRVQIDLPAGWAGAIDADGQALLVQESCGRHIVELEVPACGWTSISQADGSPQGQADLAATPRSLENDVIRAEFNEFGEITSLVHKADDREFLDGVGNCFRMYKDVPSMFDAWDIDSMYEQAPVPLDAPAEVEVLCRGPLMAQLRITRPVNNSEMTQLVTLRRGSACLEFETTIDWDESHKLLKVGFDSNIRTDEAIHEIQFGCLKRPTHRSMPFDRDRYEVANQKYTALAEARRGLAVLNDSKYGVSVLGGSINLSLLRASKAPDPQADIGRQTFTYAVSIWQGGFADSGVIREGYALNIPPTVAPGRADAASLLGIDADNVILEALKPAQDGSGDFILRLYEAVGTATRATLKTSLPIKAAAETNMLETDPRELDVLDGSAVTMDFTAFEIKTLRLKQA